MFTHAGVLLQLLWVRGETTAVKKNGDAEVVEVAKASGGGFDGLDFGIETFGSGVGEVAAMDVVEEGLEVGEKCAGEALLQVRHPRLANVLRVGQVMVGNETCDFLLMTAVMVSPSVQEAALQAPETLISAKPPFATGSPGHTRCRRHCWSVCGMTLLPR